MNDVQATVLQDLQEKDTWRGDDSLQSFRLCREGAGALPLPAPTLDSIVGAVVDPSLSKVVVRIAPWPEMACGDRVVLSWHGLDMEGLPYRHEVARSVSERQVGKDIVLIVRDVHIAALDGGTLEVFWTLNSVSRSAPVSSSRIQLDVGDVRYSLLPVLVEDAVRGCLDPARVPDGTTAILQPYAGMGPGDRVELIWQGPSPQASFRDNLIVEFFAVGQPLVFGVAPEFIAPHSGGEVSVRYRVEQKSGAVRESGVTRVSIAPLTRGELPAPRVLEAEDGVLDMQDAADGISVMISDAQVEEGELVYLKCDGESFFHRDDREIIEGMAMQPLVFIVPYRFWREHANTVVRLSYSVERLDDVSQESGVTLVRVQA
ncbi:MULTISPECIES: hypothetical protein [Pseudomonas]|uniref:hypothetical protein n=1 Tax=Pseudomonas TaxID=286 RepID=UPI001F2380C5|nr:hypothetical protein [Pseudomonas sputi]